jgi:hypothetical protein
MSNLFDPPKFAIGSLIGADPNAYALMAHFRTCARKSGWSKEDTDKVVNKSMDGEYYHLVTTLDAHLTEEPDSEGGEE